MFYFQKWGMVSVCPYLLCHVSRYPPHHFTQVVFRKGIIDPEAHVFVARGELERGAEGGSE